ncbi:iron chaperone [Donghicola tyrosinivorans]|uniref:Uncharacterized protein YdhG (YjbR/CyaY superfamily) n=1 Tax=Donghicola tyrosinivorans TaxID=1652492 RepID=A0A2T0WDL5_9RHOB|nr:DUF1801 domain-containing protein [Donghicola tyrosinivorans]PRY84799.1 uncharacterized protein YdhG (YjbR/CyaY superfamily) [Donghicola tyrosinivorans]
MAKFASIDQYIETLPPEVRKQAQALRCAISSAAEGLVETICYDMPAFQYNGVTVIYFAFWKKHIGLYPIYRGTEAFEALVAPFRAKTDTLQLPLHQPVPDDLVDAIVKSQMAKLQSTRT